MNEVNVQERDGTICPKRLWVMLTLSDDELLEDGETPPRFLQLHLSRCDSCRVLAERLSAVLAGLRAMSEREPAATLATRANARARTAIRQGAKLTGRVTIPDEPEPLIRAATPQTPLGKGGQGGSGSDPRRLKPVARARYARYAAAAAILVAATLFGLWRGGSSSRDFRVARSSAPARPRGSSVMVPPVETSTARVAERRVARGLSLEASHEREAEEFTEADASSATGTARAPCARRRGARVVCVHHSHVEAAMCEKANCIHRAVILPAPEQVWRRLSSGTRTGRKPGPH